MCEVEIMVLYIYVIDTTSVVGLVLVVVLPAVEVMEAGSTGNTVCTEWR